MTRLIPVDGHPSLARDKKTGAVLNINKTEVAVARARKHKQREDRKNQETLQQQVNTLQTEMSDIKALLQQLVNREQ